MQLGNRYSQHSFAQVPEVNIPRSSFDRSHALKDTMDFDYLNPIFIDEVIPGDTMSLNTSVFARLATQQVPIMDNMYIDFFFFFVPCRLVYNYWERMMGAQPNPGDTTDFTVPFIQTSNGNPFPVGSIYDKFGLPTGITTAISGVNAMPFRAYNLIWNEWFRDQNMQNSVTVNKDLGPDAQSTYTLLKRGKRHDYFTSALPWAQKSAPVTIPIGTMAPVKGIGKVNQNFPTANQVVHETGSTGTVTYAQSAGFNWPAGADGQWVGQGNLATGGKPQIWADLTEATAATINQLREAFMMQSLFELDARGGTRYTEILTAHYGVTSEDFRLQRPEYLGGGEIRINSHPVAQTAPTETDSPQANLAAFGTAAGNGIGFDKSFVEHGYVIGLACARADITYQQGINRLWTRRTRFDFFWPKLQEMGEQTILNKEIYCQGGVTTDNEAFGFQERYAEYRYKPSEIHGELRSTFAQSLDFWHMAQEFGSLPGLNSTFIEQSTPIERAIAVPTAPHLLFDAWYDLKHARPMMTYAVPATLGHF